MNEQVLLFHITDEKVLSAIRLVLAQKRIIVRTVALHEYNQPIGVLAGVQPAVPLPPYAGPELDGAMMVLRVLPSHLDDVLAALRAAGIPPIPKAILTRTNAAWTAPALLAELKREQEEIRNAMPKNKK